VENRHRRIELRCYHALKPAINSMITRSTANVLSELTVCPANNPVQIFRRV